MMYLSMRDTDREQTMGEDIELLDTNESGDKLYSIRMEQWLLDPVSCIVTADGTELFPEDFQGEQAKTFADVPNCRWYESSEINW